MAARELSRKAEPDGDRHRGRQSFQHPERVWEGTVSVDLGPHTNFSERAPSQIRNLGMGSLDHIVI